MQEKLLLQDPVRYFKADGKQLHRVGFIDEGSHFFIGAPEMMIYDHHDQLAIPFTYKDRQTYYLLVKELSPEQQEKFKLSTVH